MAKKETKISAIIIEIADILFAEPDKKIAEIMREFAEKCGKQPRTVERWIKKAKEYNGSRLNKQEKAKDEVLVSSAKESIKKAILTREKALTILSEIALGNNARSVQGEIIVPSDSERINAVKQIAQMEGWNAASKLNVDIDKVPTIKLPDGTEIEL